MRAGDVWAGIRRIGRARLACLLVLLAVAAALTALGIRWVSGLRSPEALAAFGERIAALGPGGWFALLAVQYLQVVLAFVPGGPVQIVSGALYGPVGAVALIVVGLFLANLTIFALVRRLGRKTLRLLSGGRELSEYRFFGIPADSPALILLLYFVPGTPKDALTYLFALSGIGPFRFCVLSIAARLPAVLVSVLAGYGLSRGRFLLAAALFAAIAVLGIVGYFVGRHVRRKADPPATD
ncbi:MAG: VTT domain-containing protein [Treponema sp.]|nr:VTT domain-containing protein [Treponema sp.]